MKSTFKILTPLLFLFMISCSSEQIDTSETENANIQTYARPSGGAVTSNTWNFDETNQLTFTLDLNKLLVPTSRDSTGVITDVSVPAEIIESAGQSLRKPEPAGRHAK